MFTCLPIIKRISRPMPFLHDFELRAPYTYSKNTHVNVFGLMHTMFTHSVLLKYVLGRVNSYRGIIYNNHECFTLFFRMEAFSVRFQYYIYAYWLVFDQHGVKPDQYHSFPFIQFTKVALISCMYDSLHSITGAPGIPRYSCHFWDIN